ncbi:ATPase AAA [Novimethylophilus kurashikiensis]|uniref:ATPase AAA n=1 Tax=Novimethylophilus kurashikiensis TaxID=1825523 RepID=A0A2R5F6U6_9PROT|nr:ATP-binding protein [Novimethylophilus kurashikiensis]GBG13278.1 ATPase AAA [Novimethylophilus kurashikiensis]
MNELTPLLQRAEQLIARLENLLPTATPEIDWSAHAWRWRKQGHQGYLQAVAHPRHIRLADLQGIDRQKNVLARNTLQFVRGLPANNVLLTGSRGTGKSSLIKALLAEYASEGLRLVEVEKNDLVDLPDIAELLSKREERFLLFCDDLSFESDDPSYKALKVALDGSIAGAADNMLIYATSNRRHLMPEFMSENMESDEIRPGDTVEEKIALSERFGVWLSFYPFDQDEYLAIVKHWLVHFGITRMTPQVRQAALQWALGRGSRSGRVAWQFARDWAGQKALNG